MLRQIIYCRKARAVVTDSELGKEHIIHYYKVPQDRIFVIPYISPKYIYDLSDMDVSLARSIIHKYNLPERFLLYPAQFWPHKNHLNLLKAILLLESGANLSVNLVLTGSPKQGYPQVLDFISTNKMTNVSHIGYVSSAEIVALYKCCVALVYPSVFGPTNIPPLEAMKLGAPVLCSNVFAMPKQLGNAALLFDPNNVEDIANSIREIWTSEHTRATLIERGNLVAQNVNLFSHAHNWVNTIRTCMDR